MKHTKLSDHTFKKGKFITPINSLPMMKEFEDEKSWTYGRMPEYLWIGLLLKYYGREEGLRKSYGIISALHKLAPELYTARMSQILKLNADIQKNFYDYIISVGAKEALAPLTIYLTVSRAPIFAECFYCPEQSVEDMILNKGECLPEHFSNAKNVYITVVRGTLSATLNEQETHEYQAGTVLKVPFHTKMNLKNVSEETLEFIVVKAPAPNC